MAGTPAAGLLLNKSTQNPSLAPAYEPTSSYESIKLAGFKLYVSAKTRAHPEERAKSLKMLEEDLAAVGRLVPAGALKRLRQVRFWVEWEAKPGGAAEYHPGREWLRENGYNPEKWRCVEINNVAHYIDWSRRAQPMMVLHELAHSYHDRVLGFGDERVKAAYDGAVAGKRYESVEYVLGGKRRAYALTDPQEYFAELTEAWFGKNDFYPFTRAELAAHDPEGYALMRAVWGSP